MKKETKLWLITAFSLVLIGCIISGSVMCMLKWDFTKLSTRKYKTSTYEIGESFRDISITTNTADITFVLSDAETCKVECYEKEKELHSVTVEEGTLTIQLIDERAWYDHIGIHFNTPKITVHLPKKEYASLLINESTGDIEIPGGLNFGEVEIKLSTGDVDFYASASTCIKIKGSTGNICVKDISANTLDLSVSTGKVTVSEVNCKDNLTVKVTTGKAYLTDIECKNIISKGNTGDIFLKNVVAEESISIERSTGDIKFDESDGAEIFIKTDTGDVTGSLLSDKVFIAQTDTGKVDVPKTANGGKCEIETDTGDIRILIKEPSNQ